MRDDVQLIEQMAAACQQLRTELARVVMGQQEVLEQVLTGLFAGGHCLLVGVPGLAKTLLVRTLASALDLTFQRVQFTPDLMPSDITGSDILYEDEGRRTRELRFVPGPIFCHLLLADEINRTPPKTQAALLEGMQERQVTVGGRKHPLPQPFCVLATQNPIEQEGTYPLPEAQLDRFMLQIQIGYPMESDELRMIQVTTGEAAAEISVTMPRDELFQYLQLVRRVPISEPVAQYALRVTRATRPGDPRSPAWLSNLLRWGAGPRAGQYLLLAAKARAAMSGRWAPSIDDIRAIAHPVLRHRLRLSYAAEADGQSVDDLITKLLQFLVTDDSDELRRSGLVGTPQARRA